MRRYLTLAEARRAKQRRDAIIVDVVCNTLLGVAALLGALCIYAVSALGFALT